MSTNKNRIVSKEIQMGTFSRIFCVGVIIADLGAIVYLGGNYITTGAIFPEAHSEATTHQIAEADTAVETETKVAKVDPMENFVPDIAKGKKVSAKCKACHTFDKGGKNTTGPNLWNIVGSMAANNDSFSYSSALKDKSDMVWDEENLSAFLKSPRKFVKGTKMAFAGIKKPQDRANLIEWLKTLK
jgi:cytochrome c